MLQAGIIDAYSHIPFHLDFLDDDNFIVNILFTGFLGAAIGAILAAVIIELKNIINDWGSDHDTARNL